MPKCFYVTVSLTFGEENEYESLLYKFRIDKLHTSDTENDIQQIPEHCSCTERFEA
jgi:hypothetical protein